MEIRNTFNTISYSSTLYKDVSLQKQETWYKFFFAVFLRTKKKKKGTDIVLHSHIFATCKYL